MAGSSTHFVLSELRERVARLEGVATRRREVLPFGVPEIDRVLPGGALALGALHEVAGGANGAVDRAAPPCGPPALLPGRAAESCGASRARIFSRPRSPRPGCPQAG